MQRNSNSQPEVCVPTAPELDHDPRAFPPELAAGVEDVSLDGFFAQGNEFNNQQSRLTSEKSRSKVSSFKSWKLRYIACLVVIIVIIVVVAGSLGGTLNHKSRCVYTSLIDRVSLNLCLNRTALT